MNKIIVIGGGASGLVAAINAKNDNNEVIILEKNSVCGKKILVTGAGKCNYFNEDLSTKYYSGLNINNLDKIINNNNKKLVLDFFDSLGIIPRIKNGYYYPYSNQAISIQNALILEAKAKGIKLIHNVIVKDVKYTDKFTILTNNGNYESDILVLATGSRAFNDNEENDIGYKILRKFNHNIVKTLPGLVQLKGNETYFKEWSGIRTDAKLTLFIDGKKVDEETGELQLTNYGISGICVLGLSNLAVSALNNNKKVNITINFLDFLKINNKEDFINFLIERNNKINNRKIGELFDSLLNYKLTNLILKLSKINLNSKYEELNNNMINNLYNNMINFNIDITGYNGFKEAQISLGGLPLNEVNINTLESLKQHNLYICGELYDVNGKCGGYNLAFSWITGLIVGNYLGGLND